MTIRSTPIRIHSSATTETINWKPKYQFIQLRKLKPQISQHRRLTKAKNTSVRGGTHGREEVRRNHRRMTSRRSGAGLNRDKHPISHSNRISLESQLCFQPFWIVFNKIATEFWLWNLALISINDEILSDLHRGLRSVLIYTPFLLFLFPFASAILFLYLFIYLVLIL